MKIDIKLQKDTFLRYIKITVFGFFIIALLLTLMLFLYIQKPLNFKDKKIVIIPKGSSLKRTSEILAEEGIIKYPKILQWYMRVKKLSPQSGPYNFSSNLSLEKLAQRISHSDYGDVYVKFTIPEGSTNDEIIRILKKTSLPINEQKLRFLLSHKEGYLFPDTYFFLPGTNEDKIVMKMEDTFSKKMKEIQGNKKEQKSEKDIVIMASLIEKEAANNLKEKQMVSGILWKRIGAEMPLQVDAPFLYERKKTSAQLSKNELGKDSLYNTYTRKGLPPSPIGNPGYDALYASMYPMQSEYWYYLHDRDGHIHYGKNYQEHLKNIRKYLH